MSLESMSISSRNENENETEKLSFREACVEGNLKVVKVYLAQQGFDMNVSDYVGRTGFHWACRTGKLNVVQFLVQKGFDMNVDDVDGWTGFHEACINGYSNVVRFLLQKGFDINIRDTSGDTGFHFACAGGHLNVIQCILQHSFEGVNDLDFDGETGLEMLIHEHCDLSDELFMRCILLSIEGGAQLNENYIFDELISAIQNRMFEITFMKAIIFEKWTGRIAQVITNFTIDPFTNTSLQNLSQFLD